MKACPEGRFFGITSLFGFLPTAESKLKNS